MQRRALNWRRMTPPIRPLAARRAIGLARLAAAVASIALAQAGAGAAQAAGPPGLVVIPHSASAPGLSYFKVQGRAGAAVQAGTIELQNPTARRLRVSVVGVDANTLSTLGSGYAPPGSHSHGSTRWLAIGAHAVSLPAHTSVTFPVTVRIAAAARPGDYLSGVSIQSLDQSTGGRARKGVSVASVSRYAIGVEVSVPGPRTPLIRFTGAQLIRQPAGLAFQLLASNLGNTILQGVSGHVVITHDGHALISRPIPAGTFVTASSIAYPVPAFHQTPAQGTTYGVSAYLLYDGGIARLNTTVTFDKHQAALQELYGRKATTKHGTAWWQIVGVALVCLYALITTIALFRRRKREQQQPG